jgi:site-specific DNA-adenine methylase
MTAYHGGKQRIGAEIAQAIYDVSTCVSEKSGFEIKGYCEPFCGMLGVYRHIPDLFEDTHKLKYKAGDINESVIEMWKASQQGLSPPNSVSKERYEKLKKSKIPSAEKGFVGHHCSFGGIYFKRFREERCKGSIYKNGITNLQNITEKIKDVKFRSGSYTKFSNLKGYIIYCDPPYAKYNNYYNIDNKIIRFDNDKFWDWVREMSKNNIIFVSEYSAPKGIKSVLNIETSTSYGQGGKVKNIEKLYLL